MRATRAYLAGFGTSGSLLAGAALVFLLASAFVAFQGWPQVGGQSSPVSVSVPRLNVGAASRASRALTAAVSGHPGGAAAVAGGAASGGGGLSHGVTGTQLRGSDRTIVTPVSSDPGSGHNPGGGTGSGSGSGSCTVGCGGGSKGGPIGAIKHVVSGAKQTVSSATSSATSGANSTVGSVVTTVKKIIKGGSGGSVVSTTKTVVNGATGGLP